MGAPVPTQPTLGKGLRYGLLTQAALAGAVLVGLGGSYVAARVYTALSRSAPAVDRIEVAPAPVNINEWVDNFFVRVNFSSDEIKAVLVKWFKWAKTKGYDEDLLLLAVEVNIKRYTKDKEEWVDYGLLSSNYDTWEPNTAHLDQLRKFGVERGQRVLNALRRKLKEKGKEGALAQYYIPKFFSVLLQAREIGFDRTDRQVINWLMKNGMDANGNLAAVLNLPPTELLSRIARETTPPAPTPRPAPAPVPVAPLPAPTPVPVAPAPAPRPVAPAPVPVAPVAPRPVPVPVRPDPTPAPKADDAREHNKIAGDIARAQRTINDNRSRADMDNAQDRLDQANKALQGGNLGTAKDHLYHAERLVREALRAAKLVAPAVEVLDCDTFLNRTADTFLQAIKQAVAAQRSAWNLPAGKFLAVNYTVSTDGRLSRATAEVYESRDAYDAGNPALDVAVPSDELKDAINRNLSGLTTRPAASCREAQGVRL